MLPSGEMRCEPNHFGISTVIITSNNARSENQSALIFKKFSSKMKNVLLIAFLLVTGITGAAARNNLSKAANDSAMKAGRIALAGKISQFNTAATASATSAVTSQSLKELSDVMYAGMEQTMRIKMLEPNDSPIQEPTNTRLNELERYFHRFTQLSSNVAANRSEMVQIAQKFAAKY